MTLPMFLSFYPYAVAMAIVCLGLLLTIIKPHLFKKLIGLMLFQSGVIIFYMAMSKVHGGTAPIILHDVTLYSNPLPHVLMLTAIVVGIATVAVACALLVRLYRVYGTLHYPSLAPYLLEDDDV